MNDRAILSLISDLYVQVTRYQERLVELEQELAEARAELAGRDKAAGDSPAPAAEG